jgi:hypothetical protein
MKITAFWDITLMMDTVRTSETSVCFTDITWRYIPENNRHQG